MKDTKKKRGLWFAAIPVLLLFAVLCWPTDVRAEEGEPVYETLDLSEYILQAGGLGGPEELNNSVEEMPAFFGAATLQDTIYEGLANWSTYIDISDYGLLEEDLSVVYWSVVNMNPEFFYVDSTVGYYSSGDYVTALVPAYESQYTTEHVAIFNQKVDEIIAGVDESWPEIQKILYLHDYLVTHADYDLTYSNYNAYNALVEGSAVCQGYALATVCLLKEVEVDVDLITSRNLNHAWNLIEVDGEYFYTDATWDDPSNIGGTYCAHDNFMVSEAGLVATGHTTTDWVSKSDGLITYGNVVTSTKYMDYFWSDMITALPMIGTKTGYLSDGTVDIYNFSDGTTTSHARTMGYWRTMANNGTYVGDFCSLAVADGAFCYTTHDTIYRMALDGTTTKVYTLSSEEATLGRIYGLSSKGRTLTYYLKETPSGDVVHSGTYSFGQEITNFVTRMYQQCLSRDPDQSGLDGWVYQLENGYMTGADIAEQFVFGEEMLWKNLSNEEFVELLYRAMMGREASESGKSGWVYQLDNHNMTRSEVTKAFVESTEFTDICSSAGIVRGTYSTAMSPVERFVYKFCEACLENSPAQEDFYDWVNGIINQTTDGADVVGGILLSDEILAKNLSNADFVDLLYTTLFNRQPDESGKAGWVYQLDNHNMTRSELVKVLVDGEEFAGICSYYGVTQGSYDTTIVPLEMFVTRFYTLCLERDPDQAGLYGWVSNLQNRYMNGAQIANQFFFGVEFVGKNVSDEVYVELLYNTLMGRAADAEGKSGWLYQLGNQYMTRMDIMKAFIESVEFTGICDTYGITRGTLE